MPKHARESQPAQSRPVVSRKVWQGLDAVRRSGQTNMLDRPVVAQLARAFGYPSAARWIEDHPKEYAEGVFGGFDIQEDREVADQRN